MESVGRDSYIPLSKIRLHNFYTKFHENWTDTSVSYTRSKMDKQVWPSTVGLSFYLTTP